jgi:hypothetical protein
MVDEHVENIARSSDIVSPMARRTAVVGVSDHAGWAVLITAAPDGSFIDRRRVELIGSDLPSMPHHHDAQRLSPDAGVALVERVTASAKLHARACLDALAGDVDARINGVAIRRCPALPATIAERITDYRAQCVADWVMYRSAIADAAAAKGWNVTPYDTKTVLEDASRVLKRVDVHSLIRDVGRTIGPPWRTDHRLAMAAAIAAAGGMLRA